MKRKVLAFVLAFGLLLPSVGLGAEAMETLQESINSLLAILADPALKGPDKHPEQRRQLRQVISKIFDYQELSMRTVGQRWSSFSSAQQDAFAAAFADLLDAKYLDRIQGYSNERVSYVGERASKQGNIEIQTMLSLNGKDIAIAYRMVKKDRWVVYDVIIEGVSLVQNYRSQFQDILVKGTPDELIGIIKSKVLESSKGPATPSS